MSNKSNQGKSANAAAPAPVAAPVAAPQPSPTPETSASQDGAADTTGVKAETVGAIGGQVSSASDDVGAVVPAAAVKLVTSEKAAAVYTGIYSPAIQGHIDQMAASGNKKAVDAFAELAVYLEKMMPGKMMDPERGATFQVSLFRTIQLIINGIDVDFQRVFGVLLGVYNEFGISNPKGALGPQYVFRFTEAINMSAPDRKAFRDLNNLFVLLADPAERKENIKHVDFGVSLTNGLTEDGKRKVLAFFGK